MVSTGKKESSSHWAAKGLSSLAAKALAESRKASCCSVRSKFMVLTFLRIQIFEHLARKLKSASSPLSLLGGQGRATVFEVKTGSWDPRPVLISKWR